MAQEIVQQMKSLLWFGILSTVYSSINYKLAPNLSSEIYYQDGDLIIGGLYSTREGMSDLYNLCGGNIKESRLQQNIEALVYHIDKINKNDTILPNITLGYMILDDCRNPVTALAKAIQFTESVNDECPANIRNDSSSVNKIIALIGPTSSSRTIPVSQLMTSYRIPILSPESTSDDLTNSLIHAFFFRLIQPDKFLAIAMKSLLTYYKWSYISVLFQANAFGRNLARNIEEQMSAIGICIAFTHGIPEGQLSNSYFDNIVANLKRNIKARVIILAIDVDTGPPLFDAIRRADLLNTFIWIGADTFDKRAFQGNGDIAAGGFTFVVDVGHDEEFAQHFMRLSPMVSNNPWLKPLWTNIFHCRWDSENTSDSCEDYPKISLAQNYSFSDWTSRTIDSLYAIAYALDKLIRDHCRNYVHNRTLLQCCVTGRLLKQYIQETDFKGLNGLIRFDKNGNLLGNYLIKQVVDNDGSYEQITVGYWESSKAEVVFNIEPKWYVIHKEVDDDTEAPKSVCSEPCGIGEIKIQGDVPCCWECRLCRQNEYVDDNHTRCYECPKLTWPDEDKYSCSDILPTYIRWTDVYGIVVVTIPSLGLIITVVMSGIFIIKKDIKIVKASSPPLMTLVAIGVMVIFVTAITFAAPPSDGVCSYAHIGFHISCTFLYGTLCVKTTRIYRIFRASKNFRRPKTFIGDRSQIVFVFWLIFIQSLIIISTVILGNYLNGSRSFPELLIPTRSSLLMPVRTENYVELSCIRPRVTLLPPLAFNMVLLLWGALAAFLTRHLPDAFNESWYIFLSVSATLVIWFAFIPTYFMMFYAYFRETLLSLALSLNGICNVLLLFCPKVYAIYFVNQDVIKTGVDFSAFEESRVNRATVRSSHHAKSPDGSTGHSAYITKASDDDTGPSVSVNSNSQGNV